MNILYFTICAVCGCFLANEIAGKYEGDKPERSLRFLVKGYYIHVHHWIYASVIAVFLLLVHVTNIFIFGFVFGIIIQGLCYKDRFIVFYKKENYLKIYQKWLGK